MTVTYAFDRVVNTTPWSRIAVREFTPTAGAMLTGCQRSGANVTVLRPQKHEEVAKLLSVSDRRLTNHVVMPVYQTSTRLPQSVTFCLWNFVSFRSPSLFYLFTAGVEVVFIFTWSHSDTHHSRQDSSGRGIGPSQRPLPDNTNTVQETNIHAPGGIRTHNPSKRSASDLCLRSRGRWDRLCSLFCSSNVWQFYLLHFSPCVH
jgi:hypothetical protein